MNRPIRYCLQTRAYNRRSLSSERGSFFQQAVLYLTFGPHFRFTYTDSHVHLSASTTDVRGELLSARGRLGPALSALASCLQAAPPDQWLLPRGDGQSTGRAEQTLPEELVVRWEYQADEAIEATPVVGQGRVLVADVMGQIYAIDQSKRQELWRRNYDTGFLASPAIRRRAGLHRRRRGQSVRDRCQEWRGTLEANHRGRDQRSGRLSQGQRAGHQPRRQALLLRHCRWCPQWTYQTDDQIRCSPTVAGDRTFLGGCDGQLHMVDLKTGQAIGQPLPLGGPTGSTPAVQGTKAFLPIMDGVVLAFDWQKPSELWSYEDEERRQEYRNSAASFRRTGHCQQPEPPGGCHLDRNRPAKVASHAAPPCRCIARDRRPGRLDRRDRRHG